MTKRITPTDMAVGRLLGCEPAAKPALDPGNSEHCCGSKADWRYQNCKSGAAHRVIVFAAAIRPCTYKPAMSG